MRLIVKEDYAILHTTYRDNKFIDEEYKKELEKLKDEDEYFYNVYALGLWSPQVLTGRIYKKWDGVKNLTDYTYKPQLPIIICCDFNVMPMKWALLQEINGIDYIFDEIIQEDTDTEEMAKEVYKKYGNVQYEIFGDYSGTFRHTSSKTTDYQLIKQYLPTCNINVKPNPPIVSRVNATNWRLCNKEGKRRLFVRPECKHVIADFNKVVWKAGKREEDQSNMELTHISSAIGYYCEYKYPLRNKPEVSWGKAV